MKNTKIKPANTGAPENPVQCEVMFSYCFLTGCCCGCANESTLCVAPVGGTCAERSTTPMLRVFSLLCLCKVSWGAGERGKRERLKLQG